MSMPSQVECTVHFRRRGFGARKVMCVGPEPERVPRLARLMALALRFEALVRDRKLRGPFATRPRQPGAR